MSVTTITISKRTKIKLASIKGKRSWDELLNELYDIYVRERRIKLAKEFEEQFKLSEDEYEKVKEILEESRRRWRKWKI